MMMNNIMGAPRPEEQVMEEVDEISQYDKATDNINSKLAINFADKIMGGMQGARFMEGKLKGLDGMEAYSQKIKMLTGHNKMNTEKIITPKMNDTAKMIAENKVALMLQSKATNKSFDSFFSPNKNKKFDINNYFGKTKNKNINVSGMLGVNSGKTNMEAMQTKIKNVFGQSTKSLGTFKPSTYLGVGVQKQNAVNKINNILGLVKKPKSFNMNVFGNPEKTATRRMNMQKGLPMFGDFDGDKLMNILDCNPRNPMLQGEQHNIQKYLPGEEDSVDKLEQGMMERGVDENNWGAYDETDKKVEDMYDNALTVEGENNGSYVTATYKPDGQRTYAATMTPVDPVTLEPENNVVDNNTTSENNVVSGNSDFDINQKMQSVLQKMEASKDRTEITALQKTFEQLSKSQRANLKQGFDEQKYEQQRKDKQTEQEKQEAKAMQEAANKRFLAQEQLKFEKSKFGTTFGLQKAKSESEVEARRQQFDLNKTLAETTAGIKQRQQALSEIKADRDYKLSVAKLKAEEQKGDIVMMEKKLRAGKTLMDGLLGGSGSPVDFKSKVSSGATSSFNPSTLVGMNKAVPNPYGPSQDQQIMARVGGGMQDPYAPRTEDKIMMSVGAKPSTMSAMDKANMLSGKKVEQPEVQVEEQPVVQARPQPAPAPQPVYVAPQPQPQYARLQPQYVGPQPQQYNRTNINWDRLSPEQAAQIDPEYAKYMAESEKETVYRRGPYKKR